MKKDRKPSLWGTHDILKGDKKTNRHLNGILGGFDTSSRFFCKLVQCQIAPHNWWVHEKIEHTGSVKNRTDEGNHLATAPRVDVFYILPR